MKKKVAQPENGASKGPLDAYLDVEWPLHPHLQKMPIEHVRALVAAEKGEGDRRSRALAYARELVSVLEHGDHADLVPRAIEAAEKAHAHLHPPVPKEIGERLDLAYVERVIAQLDWARSRLASGATKELATAALAEMEPGIPATRWRAALEEWRGEIPAPRGPTKKGSPEPYRWHRVLYRLLTGKVDVEPDATHLRDNLRHRRDERR